MQSTIKRSISIAGLGLHSGSHASITIHPAPINHRIQFIRADLKGVEQSIAGAYDRVAVTPMCTIIRNEYGVQISTIEHIMAALYATNIDNAIIEVSGPEIPILDGSSIEFVRAIQKAGVEQQQTPRSICRISRKITVELEDKYIYIEPYHELAIDYSIDFPHPSIGTQRYYYQESNGDFIANLAPARTFGFIDSLEDMKAQGMALGASLQNAIGLDKNNVLNPEGLRFPDEFIRHKILDCIGDLYLYPKRIIGKITAHKGGHKLHNQLLRAISLDSSNIDETL